MKLSTVLEAGFVEYSRLSDDQAASDDIRDANAQPGEIDQINPSNDQVDDQQPEDIDRQGDIRTVPSAHLVYKRKSDNNLYDELWIYKQNQHDTWTMKTYDAIIAGSDIPKGSSTSEDGTQTVERWEVGDPKDTLVFVKLTGLAN